MREQTVERTKQDSPETQAILQRMEEVRCDLDEGVQEIVETARDMGEWRYYVKNYPWICLGAACAVGYVIVPRRRLGVRQVHQTLAEIADHSRSLAKSEAPAIGSVRGTLLSLAGNLLWRAATSYATRQASQYFAAQSVAPPQDDQP